MIFRAFEESSELKYHIIIQPVVVKFTKQVILMLLVEANSRDIACLYATPENDPLKTEIFNFLYNKLMDQCAYSTTLPFVGN